MSNLQGEATLRGSLSQGSGSTGTTDYEALSNKPSINNVELSGNKTTEDLGLFSGDYNDLSNKPTIHTYTAGEGITIENDVISATGSGSSSIVYLLKIHAYGFANETLTLTDENENEVTIEVETNNEIVTFEIMNAGTYTLTNSINQEEQEFTFAVESSLIASTITSIIPVLSTNVGSNGLAIAPASSPNYGNGNAFKAFDNDMSTWLEYLGENQSGAYVGYVFDDTVYIDNIVSKMGNYASGNSYQISLELTTDGITWTNYLDFVVAGYSSGRYGTFTHTVKKAVRGFRYKSTQEKTGGNNWYTYEITCNGYEF